MELSSPSSEITYIIYSMFSDHERKTSVFVFHLRIILLDFVSIAI